jgi:MFS family permease
MFGSIMTFGGMIGAIFSGKVADLMGRKGTMWFAQIFCIFGWVAVALAKDSMWLDIGRLSTGFAVGLLSYVVIILLLSFFPFILCIIYLFIFTDFVLTLLPSDTSLHCRNNTKTCSRSVCIC